MTRIAVTSKLEAKVRRRLQKSDPELLSPSDWPRDREVITRTSIDRRRRGVRSEAIFKSEFVRETTRFEGLLTGLLAWTARYLIQTRLYLPNLCFW